MGVQMRTILEVADNSGAKKLACILPLGGSTGRIAGIGDVVTASVKEAAPESNVKKGSGREGCDRPDAERTPASGRNLYSV